MPMVTIEGVEIGVASRSIVRMWKTAWKSDPAFGVISAE